MIRRHPSRSRLSAWLAGADDPSIDDHLATCARCASVCEDLEAPPADGALSSALLAALSPPPDLGRRLETSVAERLDSRVIGDYVFDLFAAGFDTSRLLMADPGPDPRRNEGVENNGAAGHTVDPNSDPGDSS